MMSKFFGNKRAKYGSDRYDVDEKTKFKKLQKIKTL